MNMKSCIKKCIFVWVLVIIAIPNIVYGASFSFQSSVKESNITKIPVKLDVREEEQITKASFGCKTDNADVSCTIETIQRSGIIGTLDASGITLAPVSSTIFTAESTVDPVANVVLNNSTNSKVNVRVELTNPKLDGYTSPMDLIYTNTEVGAKPVERTNSVDASLKSVKFSQGTMAPEFNKDVTEYTVYNIADTINSIKVSPVCNVENTCDVSIAGGKSVQGNTVTLNQGENKVTLTVTSEDGNNTLSYNFTVFRGETSYNSAKISTISFGDYILTPAFSKDVTEYKLTVPNKVNSVASVFQYTLEDEKASIDIQGLDNLVIGENTLNIKVDNVNGDQTINYVVTILRMSDQDIEIIRYINHEITFKDSEGLEQTLSEDEFKIQYEDEWKKIQNGDYKFDKEGNIIIKDNSTKEEKDKKKKSKVWLIVLLIVIGLAIIVVAGILIFKKKSPDKDKKKKKKKTEIEDEKKDYIEEKKLNEDDNELEEEKDKDVDDTMEIDEALTDLMNTKPSIHAIEQ